MGWEFLKRSREVCCTYFMFVFAILTPTQSFEWTFYVWMLRATDLISVGLRNVQHSVIQFSQVASSQNLPKPRPASLRSPHPKPTAAVASLIDANKSNVRSGPGLVASLRVV